MCAWISHEFTYPNLADPLRMYWDSRTVADRTLQLLLVTPQPKTRLLPFSQSVYFLTKLQSSTC